MYIPSPFQFNERISQIDFINQYSFGTLVTTYQDKLEISHVPFLVDNKGEFLLTHLAKENPHWESLEKANDLKVCFHGPDAYISPSWYTHKKGVPTWNYLTVHVSGKAAFMADDELVDLLDKLSQKHEAQFDEPWKINKLTEQQLKIMVGAIVGIKISIDSIQGNAKLSQNKVPVEFQSVMSGLSKQSDPGTGQILEWMRKVKK